MSERLAIYFPATCSTETACTLHTHTLAINKHCFAVRQGLEAEKFTAGSRRAAAASEHKLGLN